MDFFSELPEGCVSDILSLSSPRDVCRSSAISKGFKSVADSDAVWDRFLPSDHREIVSRSVTPVPFSSKKQLYFCLADSPILLDGGKLVIFSTPFLFLVESKQIDLTGLFLVARSYTHLDS